jgi:hypothetical protein
MMVMGIESEEQNYDGDGEFGIERETKLVW